ncbi:MAG: hypothetical protein ACFFBD_30540 [Candidatus Hodarchaeota archaeon]
MVFSTVEGRPAAVDSTPHDRFTDGFGNADSWLTLPEPVYIKISKTIPSETTSLPILPVFFAVTILAIVTYLKSRKKRL